MVWNCVILEREILSKFDWSFLIFRGGELVEETEKENDLLGLEVMFKDRDGGERDDNNEDPHR